MSRQAMVECGGSIQPDSIVASIACGVSVLTHKKPPDGDVLYRHHSLAQDALTKVQSHRHLGVIFSHDLRCNNHVDFILAKV